MKKLARGIVRLRIPILIVAAILLIPSYFGMKATRINYDVLMYLPGDIETMKGQDILEEQFGTAAYSMLVCENMSSRQVEALKAKVEQVDHVKSVIWYDTFMDTSIPMSVLPQDIYDAFNNGSDTLMFVLLDTTSSSDESMQAVTDIRQVCEDYTTYLAGMTPIVQDTKLLADKEVPIYVGLAVALSLGMLMLTMDSFFTPLLFLLSIGFAIMYNMGTNILLGEISYITNAIAAVLQLGVTLDYSIFLWNSYLEQVRLRSGQSMQLSKEESCEAMADAIVATVKSVVGSSVTTIAGFIALCFMSYRLGMDMGLVMAKGVIFGVLCAVTVLPCLILLFSRALIRTRHKPLLPKMEKLSKAIVKYHVVFAVIMICLMIPFGYFQAHTDVYYDLSSSLPDDLESVEASRKVNEDFNLGETHMLLIDKDTPEKDIYRMMDEMEQVDGVDAVLGIESVVGPQIPMSMVPESLRDELESGDYKLMIILQQYFSASDEVNAQIDELNAILKKYDPNGMLIGEAPCTKDLIEITDHDFGVVDSISIVFVFLIIALVFRSVSLPVLLVAVIETAIFINLGIPYFTHTKLPFIAGIVISTIQLGSTVDYAILMTSRYEKERIQGKSKQEAIGIAHSTSMNSIMVSAFSFFAATFGVGLYSEIDIISSMCILLARGALVSMVCVLLFVPSLLWIFDPLICRTSGNIRRALFPKEKKATGSETGQGTAETVKTFDSEKENLS